MLQGLGIELIAAGANRRRLNNSKIDEHDALWRSALTLPVGPASAVISKSGHAAQTREQSEVCKTAGAQSAATVCTTASVSRMAT